MSRFAIYFAPPTGSALEAFGNGWFGRDAEGHGAERIPISGLAEHEWQKVTEAPRVYGLHATLKAPFHLAPGWTAGQLRDALMSLAAATPPIQLPPLHVTRLGRCLALAPLSPCPALDRFAGEIVSGLDPFRAPLSEADAQRRRARGLTPRREAMMSRWGYPFVFAEYRFHLTLTGPIDDDQERHRLQQLLADAIAPVCRADLTITEVCLCRQDGAGRPFVIDTRVPLGQKAM